MVLDYGKESETVEFKESTGELKEGIKSIASMLNKNKWNVPLILDKTGKRGIFHEMRLEIQTWLRSQA